MISQVQMQIDIRDILKTEATLVQEVYGQWSFQRNDSSDPSLYPCLGLHWTSVPVIYDLSTTFNTRLQVHIWSVDPDLLLNIQEQVVPILHKRCTALTSSIALAEIGPVLSEHNNSLFHQVLSFNIITK